MAIDAEIDLRCTVADGPGVYLVLQLEVHRDWWAELVAFAQACFVNAAASITVDILVGASAFTLWMFVEARRLGMRYVWVYLLTNLVAFAFSARSCS